MASVISAGTTSSTSLNLTADTSGVLQLASNNGTVAMSISTAQVVSFTNQPTFTGGTANGVAYLNGSKVVTTGSALTFDGSRLGINIASPTLSLEIGGSNATGYIHSGVGVLSIGSKNNYPVSFDVNNSEAMRLTSTGLGIGTSSPAVKLHAYSGTSMGQITVDGAGAIKTGVNFASSGTVYGQIYFDNTSPYDMSVMQQYTTGSLRFGTNNTERMRIDSSGNLGLGVTPSAWSTITPAIQMGGGGAFIAGRGTNPEIYMGANCHFNGTNFIYKTSAAASRYDQDTSVHKWFQAASGTAGNAITFTQAMTLDASGRLLINQTSATYGAPLELTSDSSGVCVAVHGRSSDGTGVLAFAANNSSTEYSRIQSDNTSALIFGTGASGTARARIDSSGNLLVGTTSSGQSDANFAQLRNVGGPSGVNAISISHVSGTSSGIQYAYFQYGGLGIGSITQNGTTAVAYNTSSDYRLKNTIAPMTGALAKVAALKPVTYKWNADNSDGEGFIAHELAEVVPQCVTGEKDAVDEEGNPVYQGIDTSFLVATLTAAIKEQQALIETLTTRITALEAK